MDPRRRNLIALGAALAGFAVSAAAQNVATLREASWLSDSGRLEALTTEPDLDRSALLAAATASDIGEQYETGEALRQDLLIGEFLFKTPLLLGGQAAKAGMSCNSCHVNGRDNPHFSFPAISGAAGTADTTHSFFSETLGNGIFDPVVIPDLTRDGKVSHDPASRELERFIQTIVVEEFGGAVPQAEVIRPLSNFVRALRLASDGDSGRPRSRSITRDLADVGTMAGLAKTLAGSSETAISSLLLAGARDRLQIIHERLLPGQHDDEREWLVERSLSLGEVQLLLREDQPVGAQLAKWQAEFAAAPDFAAIETESLYEPDLLAARLGD